MNDETKQEKTQTILETKFKELQNIHTKRIKLLVEAQTLLEQQEALSRQYNLIAADEWRENG